MAPRSHPAVQPPDVEELLQTGETVVLAVDQVPFEVESRGVKNTFCLLVPLITESGAVLQREYFPNRERVWWMLRSDIAPEEIRVGMVWSAPIERSREYGSTEAEKDHYQVRRSDIRFGTRTFVEVLNLKVTHPDLNELLDPAGIPWPHPPAQRVVVRGGLSVVGPFRAQYDFERSRLQLKATTAGSPCIYRLSRGDFEAEVTLREFTFTANRWDSKSQEKRIEITLMNESDLAVLERDGDRHDAASEAQVVKWALDLMEIPNRDGQIYKEILARAGELKGKAEETIRFPGRFERFLALSESRQRVVALGRKVAEIVAQKEGFRELVELHIDQISEERVKKAIEERREEIELQIAESESRLARLNERIAGAEEEYQQRLEAWEREFNAEHQKRLSAIEERESALVRQEREMVERLEAIGKTYREEASRLGDQLVAQLPILERIGLLGARNALPGSSHSPIAGALKSPDAKLDLPAFLETSKDGPAIDEVGFLRQFERVVEAEGFVFEHEDLVNFHVLVKTGAWTILTGPSGRGKSSLPRLYAKALGNLAEYLLVPVRPDWLDDRDVIGAYNALTGRYEPAASGLVDRLIAAHEDAQRQRGGIYLICLDEMNLARIEHYFAVFLSLFEQPQEERHLKLFARGLGRPDDPYMPYRRLFLGSNLRFVGTVNVDETTHFFSPKVIDRAPIAAFDRPDLRLGLEPPVNLDGNSTRTDPLRIDAVRHADLESWIRPPSRSQEILDLLFRLDEALRRARLGLGFRLRDRILRYVGSAAEHLGEDRAVDLALLQNVVPRLRPTAPGYDELLTELQSLLPSGRFHRTAQSLKALSEDPESDFFQLL